MAQSWLGAPPMWLCCGEEMLADSSKVIAQRAAGQGRTVVWSEYEAMPHCFPFILKLPQSEHSFRSCALFCKACSENPSSLHSEGTVVDTSMNIRSVNVRALIGLSFEEVKKRAREEMEKQAKEFGKHTDILVKL